MNSPERQLEDELVSINGVPVTQIELKTLGINTLNFPHRAIEQIVEYKTDTATATRARSSLAMMA